MKIAYFCGEKRSRMQRKYKYQTQIDELIAIGCQLPVLYEPGNMSACRFAFSNSSYVNHVPQYMTHPRRMLQDVARGRANTSLLALSCFSEPSKALTFYRNLQKAFKNISSAIGDSLSEGALRNEDGLKTETADNGHFDFYEYEGCDLNQAFQITQHLLKNENDQGL